MANALAALTGTGKALRRPRRERSGSHGFHPAEHTPAPDLPAAVPEADGDRDGARVLLLPVKDIRPNLWQPRRLFDEEALRELAGSIQLHGVLQPLTVRRRGRHWELVAGERRLRAAKLAGLERVPCIRVHMDDRESALLAMVENIQRRDLHYLEEAAAIADYLRASGDTREAAAARLGRSPSSVSGKLRLLKLSPACRQALVETGLSERHARCLLRLPEADRLPALRQMARQGLTAAQAERCIRSRLEASAPPAGRRTFILKDVRLFLNSMDRNVAMVREAGINVQTRRLDTEDAILLAYRIPKRASPREGSSGRMESGKITKKL